MLMCAVFVIPLSGYLADGCLIIYVVFILKMLLYIIGFCKIKVDAQLKSVTTSSDGNSNVVAELF